MNDLWALPPGDEKWRLLEECFSLPVEQRLEWLAKQVEKRKAEHLGTTDKSIPELAIDLIKKGVRVKTYVKGKPRANNNNKV